MKIKLPLFRHGLLNEQQRDQVQQFAEKNIIIDAQIPDAVRDLEMTVYLTWILKWLNKLGESDIESLKKFCRSNPVNPNPILAFLDQKYSRAALENNISQVLGQVLGLSFRPVRGNSPSQT